MLQKPDIPDEKIIACLRDHYGLTITEITFLPLGFDQYTSIYRVLADDSTPYFLKLRQRFFNETSALVPRFLRDQGVPHIMAPLKTTNGQLWASLDDYTAILYPFVEGRDGYEVKLSDQNWVEYGTALKGLHTAQLPPEVASRIPQETYSAEWREKVKGFQARVEAETFADPVSARLADFMKQKRADIRDLIQRTERLALALRSRSQSFDLCHADLHPGNLMITTAGDLYIVDWDNLMFSPKEHDLMFVGGETAGVWHGLPQAPLFYQGYGQAEVDPVALAYFRYDRLIQDVSAFCEEILLTEPNANREAGLRVLINQFAPGQYAETAYESEKFLPLELRAR